MALPDKMVVTIEVDGKGALRKVTAPNGEVKGAGQFIATVVSQTLRSLNGGYASQAKAQTTPISEGALNTIAPFKSSFLYVDCGRWGGPSKKFKTPKRDFAVVNGRRAALCEFVADNSQKREDNEIKFFNLNTDKFERSDNPINDVLDALSGARSSVRLVKADESDTDQTLVSPDSDPIFVFLPDLHLPVSMKSPPAVSDGNHMGRFEYKDGRNITIRPDDEGMFVPLLGKNRKFCEGAKDWFGRYLDADIFGVPTDPAATAGNDLSLLLDLLAASPLKNRIHLVQIGDMYDYWIGLIRFFDEHPTNVVIGDRLGIRAGNFIDFWTQRTHDLFGPMLDKMHALPVGKKTFLFGNHDNYLSAHTPVMPAGAAAVPARAKQVRSGGIFFEHGQRGDGENRDGAKSGHDITLKVFTDRSGILRAVDPQRRDLFISVPAVSFAASPDFAVYIMGHTHDAGMTRIQVVIKVKK